MKSYKNKTIVITGAASGMGRAYAELFAAEGCRLALCDYDAENLELVAQKVRDAGAEKVFSKVLDVSDRDAVFEFAALSKAELGNANVVFNNAGIEGASRPVWVADFAGYEKLLGVNFYGVVHGTHAFLPQLFEEKEAALVNVSSVFGLVGTPGASDYCASKFAVRGFTESLMAELARSHVQVHLVHPGGIDTNIAKQQNSQEFRKKFLTTSPQAIGRYVMHCVLRNKCRIVYGNNAFRIWLGTRALSLNLMRSILWFQIRPFIDLSDYEGRIK